ncbi:MAG: hypothetical protein FJ184_06940, partial [Gammaproteobacteria bacterium]|nr:hypothetical protein [Gammaproteobacteria bacterium]
MANPSPRPANHKAIVWRRCCVLVAMTTCFFLLSLSGGGMRASTMAYGVLEQLAADSVDRDGHRSRLLDEV